MPEHMPFSGNPLDRASNLRGDAAWLAGQLDGSAGRFLVFHRLSVLNHHSQPGLLWLDAGVRETLGEEFLPLLLGIQDGVPHYAIDISGLSDPITTLGLESATFSDLRALAPDLNDGDAGIAAQARSLIDWHNRHRFCGVCGAATSVEKGGTARRCTACGKEHFPRIDPAVIMLVWRDNRALLARRAGRPEGNFSTVAGYIDQGESIEAAVRREVAEEVGIEVDEVTYHASQPWPFPSSLMIGCLAHARTEAPTVDDVEIVEARWFSREELRDAVQFPESSGLTFPGPIAISYHLIKDWAAQPDI